MYICVNILGHWGQGTFSRQVGHNSEILSYVHILFEGNIKGTDLCTFPI